ncbi:MAG: DUF6760 family protein [Prochloraceae cyanobacterium]
MSPLSSSVCCRIRTAGKVLSYPLDRLHEEVAYIAFHFHWQREDILNLDHTERQLWVEEISKIDRKI